MSYEFSEERLIATSGSAVVYKFKGPGINHYDCEVPLLDKYRAGTIARMLANAYQQGQYDAKEEIRNALGVVERL